MNVNFRSDSTSEKAEINSAHNNICTRLMRVRVETVEFHLVNS